VEIGAHGIRLHVTDRIGRFDRRGGVLSGLDEDRSTTCTASGGDVREAIADEEARLEIEAELLRGARQHSRTRLPTIARLAVGLDGGVRMVRTEVRAFDVRAVLPELRRERFADARDVGVRDEPARDDRLIRHDDDGVARFREARDGGRCARHDDEVLLVDDVVAVFDDDAIAIEEHRRPAQRLLQVRRREVIEDHVHVFDRAVVVRVDDDRDVDNRLRAAAVHAEEADRHHAHLLRHLERADHVRAVSAPGDDDENVLRMRERLELLREDLVVTDVVRDRRRERDVVTEADGAHGTHASSREAPREVVRHVRSRRGAPAVSRDEDLPSRAMRLRERVEHVADILGGHAREDLRHAVEVLPRKSSAARARHLHHPMRT
jgi:hypothetical protein